MTSTADPQEPRWAFPSKVGAAPANDLSLSSSDSEGDEIQDERTHEHASETNEFESSVPKVFPTRRCRFCWADVEPTIEMPSTSLPPFLQSQPRVRYIDSDPDLGELIKPCLCKGTRRYVHEGCLQELRRGMMRARGSNWERYYHRCDICNFNYRLERMWFARAISNRFNQIIVTLLTLILLVFALGFVADPILNYFLESYTNMSNNELLLLDRVDSKLFTPRTSRWGRHFAKGLASAGLLSFANVLTAITSPWQWWNMRNALLQGSRRAGTTGRDRVASISWIVILVGVVTALWKIYSVTHYLSSRYLLNVSDRIKNVNLADDDEDIQGVQYEPPDEHVKGD